MVAYVVVPGIDGSDGRHWQSVWEREWGATALRIAPGSWSAPDLADWVGAVGRAYEEVGGGGAAGAAVQPAEGAGGVVFVAHSLGCWAVARWVEQVRPGDVAAFLVAPPDPRGRAFPREAARGFAGLRARPLGCPGLVVAGEDDAYCDAAVSAAFAAAWEVRWHNAGRYGHLNSASGLGGWPEGLRLLGTLTGGDA
jgi:predicted alpha/beta hydrolase family esterase